MKSTISYQSQLLPRRSFKPNRIIRIRPAQKRRPSFVLLLLDQNKNRMNAKIEDCSRAPDAVQQDQPMVSSDNLAAGAIASESESNGPAAASPPSRDRSSDLLKVMYYWVLSRF